MIKVNREEGDICYSLYYWINNVAKNKIFRMLEYRRVGDWTPIELKECYVDQDNYVDNHFRNVRIVEAIELPDKDILVGFIDVDMEKELGITEILYRKLSMVELSSADNIEESDE